MRVRVPIAVLAIALAATGCGGKDAKSGPKTTVTRYPPTIPLTNEELTEGSGACGFVSAGDVQGAVGSPVNPGSGVRTKTGESCRWALRSGTNQFVTVVLNPSGRHQFEQSQSTLGAAAQDLAGVGDRAFTANDAAYALKGERLVIVQVVTSQPIAARKDAATKLIRTAVGHI